MLRHKASNIAKNAKYGGYQCGLTLMIYTFFNKNTSGCAVKNKIMLNQQLVEELHKPIIRAFEQQKVHSSFIDNIWNSDLADMQLISTFKRFQFLLCVIYIYSKYSWLFIWKIKRVLQLLTLSNND